MKMRRFVFSFLSLLICLTSIYSIEPNFVRSTTYKVGTDAENADVDITSTQYSDGMGRSLQSKTALEDGTDRIVCTYYDDLGRVQYVTKPFIDDEKPGAYLPGRRIDPNIALKLFRQYNDGHATSETKYHNDPLERILRSYGPGDLYLDNHTSQWYFGVARNAAEVEIITDGDVELGTVTFNDGFIVEINPSNENISVETMMDELYLEFQRDNPFVVNVVSPEGAPSASCKCVDEKKVDDTPVYTYNCVTLALNVTLAPNGSLVQELKDGFGRTVATRADPSGEPGDEIITCMEYDVLGNIVREIAPKQDPEGTSIPLIDDTEYKYNKLGQLVVKKTPDGMIEKYEYTTTGKLFSTLWFDRSEHLQRKVVNEYDDLDRLIRVLKTEFPFSEGIYPVPAMAFYYDDIDVLRSDNIPGVPEGLFVMLKNLKGRMAGQVVISKTKAAEYYVADLFSYDDEGRVATKYKIVPGVPLQQIDYAYDFQGKKLIEKMQCGNDIVTKKYKYNTEGKLENISHLDNNNRVLASYSYEKIGRLGHKELGIESGQTVGFTYTTRDWIKSIGSSLSGNYHEALMYEPDGNVKTTEHYYKKAAITVDRSYTYAYDATNRLTGAVAGNTLVENRYEYDAVGRFKNKKEGSAEHDEYLYYTLNNRLLRSKTTGKLYLYDTFGNMVIDLNKNMVVHYDWRNLPVQFLFYDKLEVGEDKAIRVDARGTYSINPDVCSTCNLDKYLQGAAGAGEITLLTTVTMIYDATGNRVLKIAGIQ